MYRFMILGFSKEHDLSMETFLKSSVKRKAGLIKSESLKSEIESRLKSDKSFLSECMLIEYFELGGQNRVIFDKNFEIKDQEGENLNRQKLPQNFLENERESRVEGSSGWAEL